MNNKDKIGNTCNNKKRKEDFMRRDFRKKQPNDKIIIYSIAGIVVLLTIAFALLMYGNSLNNDAKNSGISSGQIASMVENQTDTESASSSIGKSIEEEEKNNKETKQTDVQNGKNSINDTNNTAVTNQNAQNTGRSTNSIESSKETASIANNTKTQQDSTDSKSAVEENKKELNFQMPLEGEIAREFAKENLIFSETLQEWVTHTGIDIKAEKTSVVQAAEDGTVKSIKNDPRYGLTIVIEHENGFETVYENLLSSEFVTEGEKVIKGQSIGTVGNTAVFESADEPHLHFEVLKDSIQVDPNIYVK